MLRFLCQFVILAAVFGAAKAAGAVKNENPSTTIAARNSSTEQERQISQEALNQIIGEQMAREVQQRAALIQAKQQIVDQQKALDEVNARLAAKTEELGVLEDKQRLQCH